MGAHRYAVLRGEQEHGERGEGGRIVSPSFRRGGDDDDWGRRHRGGSRFRFFYGYPYYGYGLYDPWHYGYPYGGYGYGWPYTYSYSDDYSTRCDAAYNLGLYDALSGLPRHYVKGETPGYRGKCRDAYNAGYAEGLVEQVREGDGGRYRPPTEYEAPLQPGE